MTPDLNVPDHTGQINGFTYTTKYWTNNRSIMLFMFSANDLKQFNACATGLATKPSHTFKTIHVAGFKTCEN